MLVIAFLPGILFIAATFLWHLTWDASFHLWLLPPVRRRIHPEAHRAQHLRSAVGIAVIITVFNMCFKA